MTKSIDITHPMIARAFAHPLRIEIMGLLDNRTASPREIATELGTPLSNTSYHIRQLVQLGLIRPVSRRIRRGAVEHFYTAIVRPTIYDDAWAALPPIIKQALVAGRIGQLVKEFGVAAAAGGFDREEVHVTRTRLTLTPQGWGEASEEMLVMLNRLDTIAATDAERREADPDAETVETTAVLMLFESPPPSSFAGGPPGTHAESDELGDVVTDVVPRGRSRPD